MSTTMISVSSCARRRSCLMDCAQSAASPTPDSREEDTGIYRANWQRDGVYAGTGVDHVPSLAWTYPQANPAWQGVLVARDVVYYLVGYQLVALEATSGKVLWTKKSSPILPAIANGVLYYEDNRTLYALNLSTQSLLWHYDAPNKLTLSPLVATEAVVVGTSAGEICAVDRSNGSQRWRAKVGDTTGDKDAREPGSIPVSIASADGRLFVVAQQIISPDNVDYVNYRDMIYSLDIAQGRKQWTTRPTARVQSLTATNGQLYLATDDNYVSALDQATGTTVWTYEPPAGAYGPLAVTGDTLFIGDTGSNVVALSLRDRVIRWRFPTAGKVEGISVSHNVVYAGSDDHRLYAINEATGHERWHYESAGAVWTPPVITNGAVYFAGEQGLFALH